MVKKFINFSQNVDTFCRNHYIMSIVLAILFGISLISIQYGVYHFCRSYFLAVSGWSAMLVAVLFIICIGIFISNSYITWHINKQIGMRETVNFKNK